MTSSFILSVFLLLLAVELTVELMLDYLNYRHVRTQREVPARFAEFVDRESFKRSAAYTLAKLRFHAVSVLCSAAILLAFVFSGSFGALDHALKEALGLGAYIHGVIYVLAVSFLFSIISAPLSLYSTFVLEERFGFNKMTLKTYLLDTLKGAFLSVVILSPLLLLLFWFMDSAGAMWWIYAFFATFGFQLFLLYLYPVVVAPLFNKFSPLPEGTLKKRLLDLAQRASFHTRGIFLMDGSKRSKHANAYFTGFGNNKRIVLFDTLLNTLDEGQTEAVLAHEIGHEKKHHIKKMLVLSAVVLFGAFYLMSIALEAPALFNAFGFSQPSYHATVVLMSFALSPVTWLISPIFAMLSRKHEYEADRFAAALTGTHRTLASALITLSKSSLSNLTPHPWYSFFHYSHPTLDERVRALEREASHA